MRVRHVLTGVWTLLLLNFFPNSFTFDHYYSAPRIFRYLAPLSFPAALHLAKMILDLTTLRESSRPYLSVVVFLPLLTMNVNQAAEATSPGRIHRQALMSVIEDIRKDCPPRLLVDSWQGFFFQQVYLQNSCAQFAVEPIPGVYAAKDYEEWLIQKQSLLPEGTLLVSGIGSCVYYGCHGCGFRLWQFDSSLDPRWLLVKEYSALSYLDNAEPVRLWRWQGLQNDQLADISISVTRESPERLFQQGMILFDGNSYSQARRYFSAIITNYPNSAPAEDAFYFHAVSYWRQGDRKMTIEDFSRLLEQFPEGRWAAGASYHIGQLFVSAAVKPGGFSENGCGGSRARGFERKRSVLTTKTPASPDVRNRKQAHATFWLQGKRDCSVSPFPRLSVF